MKNIRFVLENTGDENGDQLALLEALKEKHVKMYQNAEGNWVCSMNLRDEEIEKNAPHFFIDADSKVYVLDPASNGERIELFTHVQNEERVTNINREGIQRLNVIVLPVKEEITVTANQQSVYPTGLSSDMRSSNRARGFSIFEGEDLEVAAATGLKEEEKKESIESIVSAQAVFSPSIDTAQKIDREQKTDFQKLMDSVISSLNEYNPTSTTFSAIRQVGVVGIQAKKAAKDTLILVCGAIKENDDILAGSILQEEQVRMIINTKGGLYKKIEAALNAQQNIDSILESCHVEGETRVKRFLNGVMAAQKDLVQNSRLSLTRSSVDEGK